MKRLFVIGILAAAGASVSGQVPAQVPVYGPGGPYWGYPAYGPPCAVQPCPDTRVIRREVQRELRQDENARTPEPQSAAPPPRAPPPPTRVEEIRPEYEGASQIRDEYRRAGEPR
jgi:hypothetical protein